MTLDYVALAILIAVALILFFFFFVINEVSDDIV